MSTYSVGTVVGSIGGVASAVSKLADGVLGVLGGSDGSWLKSLKQASYGGIPFGVISSSAGIGRRVAVHEYPERDEAWVEDLGKRARRFGVIGFLLQDDLVYKGGPVIQQRDRLVDVLEKRFDQSNPGLQLVHPTMGTLNNVCCINCEIQEHAEHGGYFEIRFDFIVSGARKYPASATSTTSQVESAAAAVKSASLLDYLASIAAAVKKGAAVVKQAISTVVGWYTQALGLVNDVRRVFRSVSTLAGNFGSLFGGANNGYSGSNAKAVGGTTAAQLLASDTAKRAAVSQAAALLAAAAASPAEGAALSAAASSLAQALLATASDPADGVRLLSRLALYQPSAPTTSSQTGQAMAAVQSAVGSLLRRTTLAELAVAASNYQPASSEDAIAVRNMVSSLISDEIQIAGDSGNDETYVALIGLRYGLQPYLRRDPDRRRLG
ncbi:DNA circulation family protein [Herbaspirillum sp. RU 5E]|nr:DNA circulation family protein [Herbaspirillum sp. RU 5E]